ncbi:MAG: AAA family ATPase, partial [Polyangiaceae bacterium]
MEISGEPLDRMLERLHGEALELGPFLQLASDIAAALGQVHGQGLIHKDIKPANVIVDAAGRVRLTGFGLASRLRRERQALGPPESIAGTLPYMAPEQTGRMNRAMDARSDLYSLGVTLYELLTGALPFTASDPMEWIHCHIARQPSPPSELVPALPPLVDAIVLKLLAKDPEDRYRSAVGLEADLRVCLAAWRAQGSIPAFALAQHDVSDRSLVSQKLYGREAELGELLLAFERVVGRGTTELVLVSGYAGIGKSSIVKQLQRLLVPRRGLFAAGKFDQYKRDIPYATLAEAFQSLVRPLLNTTNAELAQWQGELLAALGPNGQLMVNLIPELALVIGEQPPIPAVEPHVAQARFHAVFCSLLGVFAKAEQPLVLFLDDLQWVDAATLHLLERLVLEPEARSLLLIGAYRDNEVGSDHPLLGTLAAIRRAGGEPVRITLGPLESGHLAQLAADALHTDVQHTGALAELLAEKTGGNPFFAIEFITALVEDGLVTFDSERSAWRWDVARIRAQRITDNLAELMSAKLSRLPAGTRQALGQLACLGNVAALRTLAVMRGCSDEQALDTLRDAVDAGLIRPLNGSFAFAHDRVQEAAYASIPPSERPAAHLSIARVLMSLAPNAELDEQLFEIVHQYDRGASALGSEPER